MLISENVIPRANIDLKLTQNNAFANVTSDGVFAWTRPNEPKRDWMAWTSMRLETTLKIRGPTKSEKLGNLARYAHFEHVAAGCVSKTVRR